MKQRIRKLARLLISLAPAFAFGGVGCGIIFGEAKIPENMLKN